MAELTIEIHSDGPHYPRGNVVNRGDKVIFQLVDVPATVEVSFDASCCFTSSAPFSIDPSSFMASRHEETVSATASAGKYYFTVDIPDSLRSKFPHWEVKRGEVDVSTDERDA
ncbi:hypothetical protein [Archangium sp.]|jgi:hypothetical protein|uniref:hypothetical protein n=1 Tax=Archangium sp. TaxID=1872627 RepID=UPI002ED8B317